MINLLLVVFLVGVCSGLVRFLFDSFRVGLAWSAPDSNRVLLQTFLIYFLSPFSILRIVATQINHLVTQQAGSD